MSNLAAAAMGSALALLCACAPASETAGAAMLAGTSWTMVAVGGQAQAEGPDSPTIAFDAEGRVFGSAGCNRFTGGYTQGADGALTLGGEGAGLGMTRMLCEPAANELEMRVVAALEQVARYSVSDGRLTLSSAAGDAVIEAVPADEPA